MLIGLIIGCILLFVFLIFIASMPLKFKYKTYFLNGYINHNEITKIHKGDCLLKFESDKFFIIQDNEIIEDNSSDIYNMRIWTFKGGLYLAIKMKTHSEYKFSLVNPAKNSDSMSAMIFKVFDGLAKRLKVELIDCGESEND